MASSTEAQIRNEIERLTATINQHKAQTSTTHSSHRGGYAPYPPYQSHSYPRSNTYVNPNYKPANKYIRPGLNVNGKVSTSASASTAAPSATAMDMSPVAGSSSSTVPPATVRPPVSSGKKEVVLGGVAFESSGRSLVRKDLPKPSKPPSLVKSVPPIRPYSRKAGHIPPNRVYKPKGRRGRNMTLHNTRRPYSTRKSTYKKSVDKPCPRFTTTGACSRGLTCMYQHDPSKIAICWNFLHDNCPNSAETCNLSHEPTPERTPLCVHFLNKGRCTREKCLFPHVNVGQRDGICRDFAVLGYCEKGLDCDRQHVRECPDFAEKGTCATKGCKLPHVIRANRTRKAAASTSNNVGGASSSTTVATTEDKMDTTPAVIPQGEIGDEYISLTFHESEEEEDESGSEEEEGSSDEEEGSSSEGEMEGIQVHV